MPLRSPRFAGDPVLEACLAGQHRMLQDESGLAVMRVQAALLDLGRSVGSAGADGIFGPDTRRPTSPNSAAAVGSRSEAAPQRVVEEQHPPGQFHRDDDCEKRHGLGVRQVDQKA